MIQRVLLLLPLVGGCDPKEASMDCARDPPLTYASFGQGFMRSYCTGCHSSLLPDGLREGAPVGINLDTYADVQQWAERILVRVDAEQNPMPPGGGPRIEDLANVHEWLTCKVADDVAAGEQP